MPKGRGSLRGCGSKGRYRQGMGGGSGSGQSGAKAEYTSLMFSMLH